MASDVDTELIGLLKNVSLRSDARAKGWEYVLGLTDTEDGLNHIIKSQKYIPFILSYIQSNDAEKDLGKLAYKCLVNISSKEKGALSLLDYKKDLPEYLLSNICDEKQDFLQYKCYILSNLSVHPKLNEQITETLVSSKDLLERLMKLYSSADSEMRSHYDFLTLVFANVSNLTNGRRFFIENASFIMNILPFTNTSEPDVRRLGVAFILRNCCLETDCHDRLLNELNILPSILLPLMDGAVYEEAEMDKFPLECQYLEDSKERDKNPSVRKVLVQALITLCYSENGWNYIQSKGAYPVLRELHLWEKNEEVKDLIETWVTYYLVEDYTEPTENDHYLDDSFLIQQLQSDIIKDLPDFVI